MTSQQVYIALGSNLGDRLGTLTMALSMLDRAKETHLERCSHWYETEPVEMAPNASAFLNGAAELSTSLSAISFLHLLTRIERRLGRERPEGIRHASRGIDLDILLFGAERIDTAELTVPHPRFHRRLFVLVPLADLAPDLRAPGLDNSIIELLEMAREAGEENEPRRYAETPHG